MKLKAEMQVQIKKQSHLLPELFKHYHLQPTMVWAFGQDHHMKIPAFLKFCLLLCFELYKVQASLKLSIQPDRPGAYCNPPDLALQRAGITGLCLHVWPLKLPF